MEPKGSPVSGEISCKQGHFRLCLEIPGLREQTPFSLLSLFYQLIRRLTNRMWFGVVCTLIDNDIRHHSGQNVVSPRQILTTVMTNIVIDKSTDNVKPYSICFYHNINVKENFYNNCQNVRALIDASSVV